MVAEGGVLSITVRGSTPSRSQFSPSVFLWVPGSEFWSSGKASTFNLLSHLITFNYFILKMTKVRFARINVLNVQGYAAE